MFKKKTEVTGAYIGGEIKNKTFNLNRFASPAILVPRTLNANDLDIIIKELTIVKEELIRDSEMSCIITIGEGETKQDIDLFNFFPGKLKDIFNPNTPR
ncbi:hypothetical protein IHV10_22125 [Fictibacillus sp. 5RED26]|uniref:hypothetical protein n=1 Tax=Fictibacillus sp. 5RED26 TaxID=2745876 RepID=UPI0018CCD5B1|nr:hypothetical protein [Fictibacillus sp. 5RED26]MBH0159070.1 hypothetical protein [Fictibacillus sp. 5RED26]